MSLKITVVNNTNQVLNLGFYGEGQHPLTQWIVKNPTPQLPSFGDISVFEIDEHIKDIVTGESYMFLSYSVGNLFWFGIQIVFPIEIFHAGYSPYYQVTAAPAQPGDVTAIQWTDPTNDSPSQRTTMNSTNFGLPSWLTIVVDPTVPDGQSLELLVSVKGKPS